MSMFVLEPAYRHYLWGGEKLRLWGKNAPQSPLAESWEVSAREDGMSHDASGRSLAEIYATLTCGEFPLLVKFIDAARDLSVQVHPDDAAAQAAGLPCGKSECWYVLESEPGAKLALGLSRDCTKEEVRAAAQDGSLPELLHWIEPKAGDCFFIPAGTIHALGAGVLVVEIQQNSDTTYRLYDYGRLDTDGKPRPLHLEQALAAADLAQSHAKAVRAEGASWQSLCRCSYFTVWAGTEKTDFPVEGDFAIYMALSDTTLSCGEETLQITRGQSVFIPKTGDKVKADPTGWGLWITEGATDA